MDTQFKSVFLAPCFHFSALTSFDAIAGELAELSNELTDPLMPWPKYSSARLFSSIYLWSTIKVYIGNTFETKIFKYVYFVHDWRFKNQDKVSKKSDCGYFRIWSKDIMHLYVEITNKYINKSHFQKMVFIDNEKKMIFQNYFLIIPKQFTSRLTQNQFSKSTIIGWLWSYCG